ncbi:FAD:protein FMN transferase [candidate division WOR-3 bacterium]|nr:FAD:protein FMN transferase [candidate division WOR-3 bacterium]
MGLKRLLLIIAFLAIAFFLFFLNPKEFTFEDFYFDTYVTGKIYSRNPILAKNAINEIKSEFERIDSLKVQGIKKGILDTTSIRIIEKSLYFSEKTNGYFDLSIDPILKRWNYFKEPTLPSQNDIKLLLPLVDYRKIKIKKDTLIIPKDFSLNLGGAAKGYALDRAKSILKKHNIRSALIDAGGDVLLVGKKKGKDNWIIGIRNPRDENGIIGTLIVNDCFVFTSGDYERYFMINGTRYHHIVDPFTGYPAREIASATVVVKKGIEGDCITTALVAMGMEKAISYTNDNDIEAMLVDTSGNIRKFIADNKLNIYE